MTDPATDRGIIAIRAELPALEALQTLDPSDEKTHRQVLDYVHGLRKQVEERRTDITRPMLDAKRKVDDFFRDFSAPLDAAIALCKARIAAIAETAKAAELAAREAEIQRRAVVLSGTNASEVPHIAALLAPPSPPPVAGASFVWEAEVTDHAQVPRDFLCVDTRAIDAYAKRYAKSEHIPAIPGVVFRRAAKVRSNGR